MKHQCKGMNGVLLRWALATSLGVAVRIEDRDVFLSGSKERFDPLSDWAQAGPLFDFHEVYPSRFYACGQGNPEAYQAGMGSHWVRGVSSLHAGCKALLVKKAGPSMEIDEAVLVALGLADDIDEDSELERIESFANSRISETEALLTRGNLPLGAPEANKVLSGIRSVLARAANHQDKMATCQLIDEGEGFSKLVQKLRRSEALLMAQGGQSLGSRKAFTEALGQLKAPSSATKQAENG